MILPKEIPPIRNYAYPLSLKIEDLCYWTDILFRISYNSVAAFYITILINQKPCTVVANEILLMRRV